MKAKRFFYLVMLLVVSASVGCVAIIHHRYYVPRYAVHARPVPDYFCYDCHGYDYFDPYYDFCVRYGFVFRWDECYSCRTYYRKHYVKIRRAHPRSRLYKYKRDYRKERRYRDPVDYEVWREKNVKKKDRKIEKKTRSKKPRTESKSERKKRDLWRR